MSPTVIHKSFVLERTYPTTAARVFRALSEPGRKRRWFADGEGCTVDSYTLDFKVGGFERTRFRFGDGPPMTNDCVYLDIVPDERICFAYAMTAGGAPMSSSLGTMELVAVAGGTLLRFTEHTAYVDGNDGSAGRREGTLGMLEALASELAAHALRLLDTSEKETTMSKVFFSVTMSLDGFIAPESRGDDPGSKRWLGQWMELQKYALEQKFLRQNLKLGEGGLEGDDNRILEQTFRRTGVTILGKRMFDGGEAHWPEDAPFHSPVFVLTHQVRAPWERKGGTTFYFVNDGIESALRQAREAAGGKDIRIGGGAHTICEYLNAGLIDEFHVALSPVFLGSGIRLFDRIDHEKIGLEVAGTVSSPMVTHLNYVVRRKTPAAAG